MRVMRWRLTSDTTAVRDGADPVVVSGIPISSGRHSGCRLRFGPDGLLYIGTGDAAIRDDAAEPPVAGRQGAAGQQQRHDPDQ